MAATLEKRIENLERATGANDPEFIAVFRQDGGDWLLSSGEVLTDDQAKALAARPGVVLIRVSDDDQIGKEVVTDEEPD